MQSHFQMYFTKDLLFVIWKDESWDINLVVYTFQFDLYSFSLYVIRYHFYSDQNSDDHIFFPTSLSCFFENDASSLRENEKKKKSRPEFRCRKKGKKIRKTKAKRNTDCWTFTDLAGNDPKMTVYDAQVLLVDHVIAGHPDEFPPM